MYKVRVRSRSKFFNEPGNVRYTVPPWVTGTYVVAVVGALTEAAAIVSGFCVSAVCGAVEKVQDDRLGVMLTIGLLGGSALSVSFVFIAIEGSSGTTGAVVVSYTDRIHNLLFLMNSVPRMSYRDRLCFDASWLGQGSGSHVDKW